jgi:flagellar basal-body rod modification protein FlgD
MEAVGSSTYNGQGTAEKPNAFSSLNSEQFMKIIFTELGNQDPLQPSDSKAMLEQLSSLRSIQSDIDISEKLSNLAGQFESLTSQSELSSAASLIGKTIKGVDVENKSAQGEVKSVMRTAGGTVLTLADGKRVPMSLLTEVVATTPPGGGGS